MNMQIDIEALKKAVADQVTDRLETEHDITAEINKQIKKRVDEIFSDYARGAVEKIADDAVKDGFEREYQKIDQWGQAVGKPTSIKKELDRLVGAYWSDRVDPRTGNSTNSTYSSVSRAEFLMTKICAEDFSAAMKETAINVTGALKDGLRAQMGKRMDEMLNDLFRVKSLMDQGKVEKPY